MLPAARNRPLPGARGLNIRLAPGSHPPIPPLFEPRLKHVIAREDRLMGTYEDEMIVALMNGGTLKLTDQFWDNDRQAWRPLHEFIIGKEKKPVTRPWLLVLGAAIIAGGLVFIVMREQMSALALAAAPPSAPPEAPAPAAADSGVEIAQLRARVAELQQALAKSVPAPAKQPEQAKLRIVNVEDLQDEVAVTVMNESSFLVTKVPVALAYHALPPPEQRLDKIDERMLEARQRVTDNDDLARAAARLFGDLKTVHDSLSLPPDRWNDAFLKAIPAKAGWVKLGDPKLTDEGVKLNRDALVFLKYINSSDEPGRQHATDNLFGPLQNQMATVLGLIGAKALAVESDHATYLELAKQAADELKKLEAKRQTLEPMQESLIAEARKRVLRTDEAELAGQFFPGEVKRCILKRAINSDWGVTVALAPGKAP